MSKRREPNKRSFLFETLEQRTQLAADGLGPSILSFSADIVNVGTAAFSINAVDSSTSAPVSTTWNFGDGSPVVTGNNVSHAFGSTGTFVIEASSIDVDGIASSQRASILVTTAVSPIRASFANNEPMTWTLTTLNGSSTFIQAGPFSGFGPSLTFTFDTVGFTPMLVANGGTITMNLIVGNDAPVAPTPPVTLVDGVVKVKGTPGDDTIEITRQGPNYRFVVNSAAPIELPRNQVDSIEVQLGDGNDQLQVSSNVRVDMNINAGAGDDFVQAGSGDDVILGGLGRDTLLGGDGEDVISGGDDNDVLFGQDGSDMVLGGYGSDVIFGGSSDDLLVGDATIYDANVDALRLIQQVWVGPGSRATRINRITNGTGILAGTGIKLRRGVEILEDFAVDSLFGGNGNDWLP